MNQPFGSLSTHVLFEPYLEVSFFQLALVLDILEHFDSKSKSEKYKLVSSFQEIRKGKIMAELMGKYFTEVVVGYEEEPIEKIQNISGSPRLIKKVKDANNLSEIPPSLLEQTAEGISLIIMIGRM